MELIETSVFTRQAVAALSDEEYRIFLLFLYPKNVRSDLSPAKLRVLRQLVADD
jgi:hypothetical protein